jgi:protease IV
MDFEQDNHASSSMPPQPPDPLSGLTPGPPTVKSPRRGSGWRIFWGIILAFSVLANIALVLMLIGVIVVFAAGERSTLSEEVVRQGPTANKIAMITVQGIIHGDMANDVYRQLKAAQRDRRVRALIVRVDSPGGTISASDQIHEQIEKFRREEKKPVVAFMQGVAASGGYYASVASDKIVAEPTALTGSIGVISWWFVVQHLLEDKLGVLPVTVKSGPKKDWPSSFRQPTPEELKYMQDKLIAPAYERFVRIVADGRKKSLSLDEVRKLADGSIYGAQEALDAKLIDQIGYLDQAVALAKSLAGISQAEVVQYRKPFSLSDFLSYRAPNALKLDRTTLYELGTPQILYLWSAY